MGNKTIFITEQCEEVLKKLKSDAEFNFSAHIQDYLLSYQEEGLNKEKLLEKSKEWKIKKNIAIEEIKNIQKMVEIITKRTEFEQKQAKTEQKQAENHKKISEFLDKVWDDPILTEKFKKGRAENKWDGAIDFAQQMLKNGKN